MDNLRITGQKWIRPVLVIAGAYHLLWGLSVVFYPELIFHIAALELPRYVPIWQAMGMMVAILGMGYLIAARDPFHHWLPVLMGMVFHAATVLGFMYCGFTDQLPYTFGSIILFNGLLWVIPFALMLIVIRNQNYAADELLIDLYSEDKYPLDLFDTSEGANLLEMSKEAPTMVVFLRHFGCTFCREALKDLSQLKDEITSAGTNLVLVHMVEPDEAEEHLLYYDLNGVPHISDPECILYKRFKLKKGTIMQLLGPKVLWRSFVAGLLKGHGLGGEIGDVYQMPGIFLLYNGEVKKSFVHCTAADRPDYLALASIEDYDNAVTG